MSIPTAGARTSHAESRGRAGGQEGAFPALVGATLLTGWEDDRTDVKGRPHCMGGGGRLCWSLPLPGPAQPPRAPSSPPASSSPSWGRGGAAMWGEGLSERLCFWGQEGGPGPSVRGKQPRQLRRMCPLPRCPVGPQWQGTATPNPCFPPRPPTAPAAVLLPPLVPAMQAPARPCCHPKALPIKAGTAETCVLWWRR